MDKERKLIIAGNWKMNKTVAESLDLAKGLVRELKDVTEVDIAVCPPFTALSAGDRDSVSPDVVIYCATPAGIAAALAAHQSDAA